MKNSPKNLEFDSSAFEDFAWRIAQDRKKALKIIKMIKEIQRNPFTGTRQPEMLKYELAGCWLRRIDHEHRIIYQVFDDKIRVLACRYHYDD